MNADDRSMTPLKIVFIFEGYKISNGTVRMCDECRGVLRHDTASFSVEGLNF